LLKGSSTMLQYRKALPLIQWKEYQVSFHDSIEIGYKITQGT
jgi:hypothetical protein